MYVIMTYYVYYATPYLKGGFFFSTCAIFYHRAGLILSVGDNDIIVSRMYSLMSCGPTRKFSTVQDVEDMLDMLENDNPFEWLEK